MNEYAKLLIEHLISWPAAVVTLCVAFRKNLRELLVEITAMFKRFNQLSLKHKETELVARAETLQLIDTTTDVADTGLAIAPETRPAIADNIQERERVRQYGVGTPSVGVREILVRADLERLNFPLESAETAEILIRQLAVQQCIALFERIYRLIFGSQLAILDFINTHGHQTEDALRIAYGAASAAHAVFYSDFPFEQWLSFMVTHGLLTRIDNGDFTLSVFGHDFLVWMTNERLVREKAW